ncbi:sulfatase-like hydrolase/transferase [Pseudoalteromonas shioyasakiensis]|uniref:sulfatase-like hydrolase/transferase n=1 Tax=Pseudoalteromonas shioyasakiensis TaxID=1190813 RepID=UPI002118D142|nr:sulfatase-like hydrolase/transferase [Pseudoalteromonas shioyasakiensis]MCQ8877591.1 sulfatase-like hydrolase/transferase [Pseudoalteromonas shioyasakiensis]
MRLSLLFIFLFSFPLWANQPPNILLITADDLGFDDLSLHGHPQLRTPNIDALAKQSVQFSDFSVTPVCSTTRAALLTGRDFYKTGVSGVHGGRDYMNKSETLISNILSDNGYTTGLWGKWHLGKTEGYMPTDRGFDEAYYAELYQHENSFGFLNGKPVKHNNWVSKVITDYTINFIKKNKSQPFFAYTSYLAPHEPWLAPERYTKRFLEQGMRPAVANLYGMIEEMDFHIGRLLQNLETQGLAENTVVIFMSDNGPWWDSTNLGAMTKSEWEERNPTKMNGNKGQSWQNGIRSPLFIRWPEQFKANIVNRYVDVKDIFPTLLSLTDTELPKANKPIDGQSFVDYLYGNTEGSNNRETYIASHSVKSNKEHFNQWTPIDDEARSQMTYHSQVIGLRNEQYKLILNPANDRDGYPQPEKRYILIDMLADPLERHNVISKHPIIANKMKMKLKEKFHQLLKSETSYAPPIFIIGGRDNISVVNGFGAASTSGNTISKAHHMTNMKIEGDNASYLIDVKRADNYDIYFKQDNTDSAGILINFSIGDNSITYQLEELSLQKIGSVSLKTGIQKILFNVLKNNSYKPWAEISGFRRLIFVPKGYKISNNELQMPQ